MSRLIEEMIISRAKQTDLSIIKKLNCWGSDLVDVSIIKRMRSLEVLALSVNKIETLSHFEDCHKLQELYLRKNNIIDINELRYLQNLPVLKYLWLEENPCCERAGPNYRAIVLRALPNLKKLDNVEVTQEEVDEALRGGGSELDNVGVTQEEVDKALRGGGGDELDSFEDTQEEVDEAFSGDGGDGGAHEEEVYKDTYEQQQQQHQQQQQQQQQCHHQAEPQSVSPQNSQSMHNLRRSSSPIRESERPACLVHYRHSPTDMTELEEHQQHPTAPHSQYGSQLQLHQQQQRRSAVSAREGGIDRYAYRNGNARENGEWGDRPRVRLSDGRFSDSASTVSPAAVNHYANYHRRPISRNSNLLSATLCLIKELDYSSLEVIEHTVRCRLDELAAE